MILFLAILLGLIQAITEFLPISSSAHLILARAVLDFDYIDGLTFDVALHVGTLFALLWYFRKEWKEFILAGFKFLGGNRHGPNQKLVLLIVAATIPGGLAGFLAEGVVETYLRSPLVVAVTLITVAFALAGAERTGRRHKDVSEISWADAATVGIAQALAIIPGVSRSGVTITAALFRGLKRDAAARFSFLLSAPLIAGAAAKKSFDLVSAGITPDQGMMLAIGIVTAAIVGYFAIAFMLRFLATHTTYPFVFYRIALGMVVLLAFWSGFR